MTQEDQPTCPDEDFEHFLKQQRLGPPVNRSGELLYQCGYAAGLAAALQQTNAATKRWRLVGLAAAAVACVSLGLNVFPVSPTPRNESIAQADSHFDFKLDSPDDSQAAETASQPGLRNGERLWESFLAPQRPQVQQEAASTLRASSWKLPLPDIQATIQSPVPAVPAANHKILQPNDYHLLFQGEV